MDMIKKAQKTAKAWQDAHTNSCMLEIFPIEGVVSGAGKTNDYVGCTNRELTIQSLDTLKQDCVFLLWDREECSVNGHSPTTYKQPSPQVDVLAELPNAAMVDFQG